MLPPPRPWTVLAPVDPEKTYLAFSSRFAMRSALRVPSFMGHSNQIMNQVKSAPGAVGYSLGADLPSLQFYTLSAWEDEASLREFVRKLAHGQAMKEFRNDMRVPSIFVRWEVHGADLPLAWADALKRQQAQQQRDRGRPNVSGPETPAH